MNYLGVFISFERSLLSSNTVIKHVIARPACITASSYVMLPALSLSVSKSIPRALTGGRAGCGRRAVVRPLVFGVAATLVSRNIESSWRSKAYGNRESIETQRC